jgi:hypothetical protein
MPSMPGFWQLCPREIEHVAAYVIADRVAREHNSSRTVPSLFLSIQDFL